MLVNDLKKSLTSKKIWFLLGVIVFYVLLYIGFRKLQLTSEQVESFISQFGKWGIVFCVLMQFLVALTPLPDTFVMLPTLFLFGPIEGGFAIVIGVAAAATVHYNIAILYGGKLVFKLFPQAQNMSKSFNAKMKTEHLILANIFSFVSFDIVAYLAGLARVPYLKFITASVLGAIPIVTGNVLVARGLLIEDPVLFILIWLISIIIVVIFTFFAKKARNNITWLKNLSKTS